MIMYCDVIVYQQEPIPGSADLVGQSPIAQGFMQSFMSHSSGGSLPYSTPLGPLSPFTTTTQQADTITV